MLPVLIIAYKRISEFEEVLDTLIKQDVTHLYIAIDGAKESELDLSNKFSLIIEEFRKQHPQVTIYTWIRSRNLGSAVSVITAVDWAFQNCKELAIIEDDLVLSEELLKYFSIHMQLIGEHRLMISGTNIFQNNHTTLGLSVSHFPVVWGWATNYDAWLKMRNGILEQNIHYPKEIPTKVKSYLETGRKRAQSGEIDAWDVPLAAWMYANKFECLVPERNLVSNRGYGINATHTSEKSWPLGIPISTLGEKSNETVLIETKNDFDNLMVMKLYKISVKHIVTHCIYRASTVLFRHTKKIDTLAQRLNSVEIPNWKSIK
jgi:hypothetical protein